MKKLVITSLFLVSIFSLSSANNINNNLSNNNINNSNRICSFITNPDLLLDRVIKKLKREKKENEIFCDSDMQKMAYYLIDKEEFDLSLGVALNITATTTNNQFRDEFTKKFREYKRFFETLDKTKLGKTPLPDKEVVRFYGVLPGGDKFFIIGKYEYNLNKKQTRFISSETGRKFFEMINLFEGIPIEYTNQILF